MRGGHSEAWTLIKDIFQSIRAKSGYGPCCEWVGEGSAGHFVKMVHNGIGYGYMQLICEAYELMKSLGLGQNEMAVLNYKDEQGYLLKPIRDTAGQKGTGKWTAISALHYGVPITLIVEADFSRCLSALKE